MSIKRNSVIAVTVDEYNLPIELIEKLKLVTFDYSLIVSGDSMYPTIQDGQKISIHPKKTSEAIEIGDIVVYHKFNTHLTVHRVIRIEKRDQIIFKTKGDYNDHEDNYYVMENEILGIVYRIGDLTL